MVPNEFIPGYIRHLDVHSYKLWIPTKLTIQFVLFDYIFLKAQALEQNTYLK